MIGKQTKGRGFRSLLDYLASRDDAQLIGGNMSGRNARELTKEFRLSRQLNPDAERVVYHVSLSAAPDDKLDDEKWSEIGNRYMKEMGFDANQFVIFRHHNTDDDHIHIAASRIRMDTGKLVHDSWDYVRSEKVLRQIEIDYDLVQVQGSKEKLTRTPSTGQIRRIRREQEEFSQGQRDSPPQRTIKEEIQYLIEYISFNNLKMPDFILFLQRTGISVKIGFTRNGKSKGISYEKDGIAFSGTQLGAAYTFPGLQKHLGINYQPQRDDLRISCLLLKPMKPLPPDEVQKLFWQQTKAQEAGEDVQQREKELSKNHLPSSPPPPASPAQSLPLRATAPPFTPPAEDESRWPLLQNYLTEKRGISPAFVEGLHRQGLTYLDQQRNVVFIKWDLDGKKSGALIWDTQSRDNLTVEYDKTNKPSPGWFHISLGGKPKEKVNRVFLCDSPIDAMSIAEMDMIVHKGLPPTRTMYMVVDDPNNLPVEYFKTANRIVLAFNNNAQGHETAQVVKKMLPVAERIAPEGLTWNQMILERRRQKQLELQRQRQLEDELSL
ncbi:relaxase/mobilization nuclease domain-containing protein [Nostoc sp. CCY0012]|uniref:relaxase/mobilization nuclease domain-containing protein n=1 Tax=Nostoc sp. CCY0012 TaxID=1056123 RepID=UPI0039C6053A